MPESLFHKVAGRLEKRFQHMCFFVISARFFRTPILYDICEWLFLVLAGIGLVSGPANLSMFFIIVCKSIFEVLGCNFQLILQS